MTHACSNDDTRSAAQRNLRNPMLWLVVGLPALVVVAGISTVVIAIRAGGSDAIPEDVRRMAQVQTAELGPDARAAEQGLSLVFSVQDDALALLPASGDIDRAAPLQLSLHHPTDAAQDQKITLAPSADGWRIAFASDAEAKADASAHTVVPAGVGQLDSGHDWRVVATAADGRWRLHGRLAAGQRAVLLRPAFDTPGAAPGAR